MILLITGIGFGLMVLVGIGVVASKLFAEHYCNHDAPWECEDNGCPNAELE